MLLIRCPWCGPRDEIEFRYGGQAGIGYPSEPDALSDEQWADYLFMRDNPRGMFAERWMHTAGCRRWFNAERPLHGPGVQILQHITRAGSGCFTLVGDIFSGP